MSYGGATERTPLARPSTGGTGGGSATTTQEMKSLVSGLLSNEGLAAARDRIGELWQGIQAGRPAPSSSSSAASAIGGASAREGGAPGESLGAGGSGWSWSVRVAGLAAGAALVGSSALGALVHFFTLRWGHLVLDAAVGAAGTAAVVLDFPRGGGGGPAGLAHRQPPPVADGAPTRAAPLAQVGGLKARLQSTAPFLRSAWGRGCLLAGAGILQIVLAGGGPLRWAAGALAAAAGAAYLWAGRSAARKLAGAAAASRAASGAADVGATAGGRPGLLGLSESALRDKFREANASGTGNLTEEEFSNLLSSLGASMSRAELEAAYLDASHDSESVPFDRFRSWCDGDGVTLVV
jgi:hypothetical protein